MEAYFRFGWVRSFGTLVALTLVGPSLLGTAAPGGDVLRVVDGPTEALPIGGYTGWVVDEDGDRIQDDLEARVARGDADEVAYLHLHYAGRPSAADGDRLLAHLPAERVYVFHNFDMIKVETRLGDVPAFAMAPGVVAISEFVPPVLTNDVGAQAIRARPGATVDDGLDHADAAHALGYEGQGMVVAVLDTGVDQNHPHLNDMDGHDGTDDPKQLLGVSLDDGFVVKCVDPVDDNGHGTHVAGTAVGTGGGAGEAVAEPGRFMGAAPGARFIDIDIGVNVVATAVGLGEDLAFDWLIDYNNGVAACAGGIDHVTHRVDVATMSFGSGGSDAAGTLNAGITDVVRSGIVFTGSAGNSGDGAHTLTTGAEGAIIVAASDDNGTVGRSDEVLAAFSSRGPRPSDDDGDLLDELRPDVAAPGVAIVSANTYYSKEPLAPETASKSGTSMATPFVAGVAALLLQANPSLAPVDQGSREAMGDVGAVGVRDVLQKTATYKTAVGGAEPQVVATGKFGLPWNNAWGYGLVDAYCAVQLALGTPCGAAQPAVDASGPYEGRVGDDTAVIAMISGGVVPYTWQWTVVSAPAGGAGVFGDAGSAATAFTPDTPGTYVLEVTVTDGASSTATDTATFVAAAAPPPLTFTGTLYVGNPATSEVGGISENVAACDASSPANGIDGAWFEIPGTGHVDFQLIVEETLDGDVWFYDHDCGFIGDNVGAQGFIGAWESGAIPAGAAHAVVDDYAGAGSFTLTLT